MSPPRRPPRASSSEASSALAPELAQSRRSRATEALAAIPDRQLMVSLDPRAQLVAERLSFGPTPSLIAEIEAFGVEEFLERQLDPEGLDDSLVEAMLSGLPGLRLDNRTRRDQMTGNQAVSEIRHATLLRAIASRRQLLELMVDFWSNHLHVEIQKSGVAWLKTSDDRDVIRPHALGRFADMLQASAQSPAMLVYLDNAVNRGDNPNENYGRELLELHTVGVEAGYTEDDVRQAALLFSGWRVIERSFVFDSRWHYHGPLRVLDFSTPGTRGVEDGLALLDYLAHHPSTARRLAHKLCLRFIGDDPPTDLMEEMARAYLREDTQIVPVLRTLFASEAFWRSDGAKLRRPFEWLVAVLRALDAKVDTAADSDGARALARALESLGQPLFGFPAPLGYPDVAEAWLASDGLLQRVRLSNELARGDLRGVHVDMETLVADPRPASVGDWVSAVAGRLLVRPLPAPHWSALVNFLGLAPDAPLTNEVAAATLPRLVGAILASPQLQLR